MSAYAAMLGRLESSVGIALALIERGRIDEARAALVEGMPDDSPYRRVVERTRDALAHREEVAS